MDSLGSPTKKKSLAAFDIYEDAESDLGYEQRVKRSTNSFPVPLTTSRLANQQVSPKKLEADNNKENEKSPIDALLAKLTEHQLNPRHWVVDSQDGDDSSSSATDPYATTPPTEVTANSDSQPDAAEILRLRKELELTRERMAQMDMQLVRERSVRVSHSEMELAQSHIARHTVEEAIGSPFPAAQHLAFNLGGFGLRLNTSFPPASLEPSPALTRPSSAFGGYQRGYTPPMTPLSYQQPFGFPQGPAARQQHPAGARLSPIDYQAHAQWNAPLPPSTQPSTYMSTTEPLNYRRLLDRNMSCNWKYIVDKIVCSNDQQASIFLQQKLKVGTPDQKFEIVQAIIDQAYPLMVNRFGNFLVQRCFEHGTPEQVVAIGQAIRGNTLNLSMDAFGCHVVQKAFDCVPEEYKAIMVHELLRRIPETVIHRYACHVWQKLFELRWSDSPPQIMRYVNEALRGMWHEVALGETGSLVVQNIFENCLEEDKRPCINEVLASIDVVAHGQFGNWCIQHICEHGSIPDRTRAVDHVLRFATEYSMDQFASKVVEKCLKVGGIEFLDRYLDRVCEAHPDRPRMALIDISGDQFGNYLIQYILTQSDPQRREIVATHIRKHMVSLRGSKYGSRVAMLCCNPAYATRPGPPSGMPGRPNSRFVDGFGLDMHRSSSSDRQYSGMGRNNYGGGYR